MFRLLLLILPVTLLALPASVSAQAVPEPGETVRLVSQGEPRAIFGRFVTADSAFVVVEDEATSRERRIPRVGLTGLAVQRGFRHHAAKGAVIGFGVGLLAGVGLAAGQSVGETATMVGISTGVSLPLGALIGWLVRDEEWVGVALSELPPVNRPGSPAASPR